jgi:hypothetical protein
MIETRRQPLVDHLAEDEIGGRVTRAKTLDVVKPVLLGTEQIAIHARVREMREVARDHPFLFVLQVQGFRHASLLSAGKTQTISVHFPFWLQLDLQVRDAILGNVGTIISFRLGLADAEIPENELRHEISAMDLISLPNYHIYLKLMIEGGCRGGLVRKR